MNSNLWFFAIHSNNLEMIQILEENNVDAPFSSYELCFKESIKCYHNNIALYIKNKYLSNDEKEDLENIQFLNFLFIKPRYESKNIFFKLVEYNLVELIKIFFESYDYDINNVVDNETLLLKSVQNNQIEMTRLILTQSNIDVNIRLIKEIKENKWANKAALHIAIENENKEIVKLLLAHKNIDVNLKCIESNDEKDIENENAEKIKIEKVSLIKKKEISKYWNEGVENSIKRKEMTPLYMAIKKNNIQIT